MLVNGEYVCIHRTLRASAHVRRLRVHVPCPGVGCAGVRRDYDKTIFVVQSLYISVVVAAIALLLMSIIVPHTLLQAHMVSLVSCFQSQQVEET